VVVVLDQLKLQSLKLKPTLRNLKLKKKNQKKKKKIPLPFCGKVCNGNCYAIRLNHSLYTQCTNKPDTSVGTKPVCTTCKNQIDKNSNGEPTYGYVTERVEKGDSFRDPKGISPVNYVKYLPFLHALSHIHMLVHHSNFYQFDFYMLCKLALYPLMYLVYLYTAYTDYDLVLLHNNFHCKLFHKMAMESSSSSFGSSFLTSGFLESVLVSATVV
jgi:hypothetical protein